MAAGLPNVNKYKRYVTIPNILIASGVGLAAILAYKYMQDGTFSLFPSAEQLPIATPPTGPMEDGKAAKVVFQLNPSVVRPGSSIHLSGYFADWKNQRVTVAQGYWYVFNDQGFHGRELVNSGSLGDNVSDFGTLIEVPNTYGNGTYSVVIADEPLNDAQIGAQNYGFGKGGIQARPRAANDPISIPGKYDLSGIGG